MLTVNEIFHSIQGESTYAGWPCAFVRLTWCNLRCDYCDTAYAYEEGRQMSIDQIMEKVRGFGVKLAEITGGEPLVQEGTPKLASRLLQDGYKVLVETSGSLDIGVLPPGCVRIVDFKTPSCGMSGKNLWSNAGKLTDKDEVKFVVRNREDYQWAKERIAEHRLFEICPVSFSPVFGELGNKALAEWMLADSLPARLNLQLHKYIWEPSARGV
ncbi:MAG: radical SAM protein [Candidatus Zixiibacteriota bacterium]